ncbi:MULTISPECIES: ester cyclase [unclassified Pseudoxanthomonas]|uniref:ester cyclase n=1 Tax=unclassified Pseudoxanthomonas TaxID=2645906 RepID=UPI0030785B00
MLKLMMAMVYAVVPMLAMAAKAEDGIQAQRNEAAVREYFDRVWSRGEIGRLDHLLAPGYINHTPSFGQPAPGPEGLKPIVNALRQAFPDLHYEIEDIIATPDHVVARVRMKGTHLGALGDIPPTGRRVNVLQINIERFENGRVVEHWRVTDELELQKQLGVVPR